MNSPIIDTPTEIHLIDADDQEIRSTELCDLLRPPALTLPISYTDAFVVLKKRVETDCTTDEYETISSESHYSISSTVTLSPSHDDKADASEARLILRLASLDVSDPYVIPERRIRTPRTPRTPANLSSRSRRTVSPVDECRGGATTPKDLLIQRYKGLTPRHSDFVNIM